MTATASFAPVRVPTNRNGRVNTTLDTILQHAVKLVRGDTNQGSRKSK